MCRNSLKPAGVPSTRWKYIQQTGRVGRDRGSSAVYFTLFEKNKSIRGQKKNKLKAFWSLKSQLVAVSKKESAEYKEVRGMFSGEGCFKSRLYDHFTLDNPTGGTF